MRLMLSSSFSNAFLGGLATFVFLSLGSSLVWAAVIAWGCFFHTGGDSRALTITIPGNILGILTAWTVGVLVLHNPGLPNPVWAGVMVFVLVMIMVFIGHQMAVHLKLTTRVIPASFYGAAATFALMVQTPGRLTQEVLLSASLENPLIAMPISMIVGAMLGFATAHMTTALASSAPTPRAEAVGVEGNR
jgi:Protein of unknown function (DUF1097)